MARLEIHRSGKKLVYEILEDIVTVGRHESNAVRVQGEGVAGVHIRISRDGDKFRAQDLCTDVGFRVNGAVVEEAALEDGDSLQLGEVVILFRTGAAATESDRHGSRSGAARKPAAKPAVPPDLAPVPRSVRRARAKAGPQRDEDRPPSRASLQRRQSMPRWVFLSLVIPTIAIVVLLIARVVTTSSFRDAGDLVTLAESQIQKGEIELALGTLETAEGKDPDATARARIAELRREIDRVLEERSLRLRVDNAGRALNNVLSFEATYRSRLDERPAARELIRDLDAWYKKYRELCERTEIGRNVLSDAARIDARYRQLAALEEPDTVEDITFRAQRRTYMRPRRYREALAILDGWIAANSGVSGVESLRELRAEIANDAALYVKSEIEDAGRAFEPARLDQIVERFEFHVEEGFPEEHVPAAEQTLQSLRARQRDQ